RGEKPDIAIIAYGTPVYDALAAAAELEKQAYDVAVYDGRFAKPIDVELLRELTTAGVPILTVEDHAVAGGFGSCVLEACNDNRLPTSRIHRLGLPMRWIYQDSRAKQLAEVGL